MTLETTSINILVVEDNPGDAVLLEEYLRMTELGISSIVQATKLSEALTLAKLTPPDLIFLDLSLPDSAGIESFLQLNQHLPNVPVIILSGLNNNELTLEAIASGAQDFLIKGDFSVGLLRKSIQYSIERKKSQEHVRLSNERFNAVSTASHDAIWDWNLQTDDFYSNDSMSQVFGYSKEEVSRGYGWWVENLHPDDRQKASTNFQKALVDGHESWQHEYRFSCADGSIKYVFGRGIILRDSAGLPYRLIGIMQDITAVYQLQQSLVQEQINKQRLLAEATIEGQEKERTELGKELHDNINQLLAATKLYLNVAASRDEMKDEMIGKSINNLNYCMEEIRKLSKALVPPSMDVLNLSDAIHDLAESMEVGGGIKITSFVTVKPGTLNNKQQLNVYRIVQEQLNNIIKHAKGTKAEISIVRNSGSIELTISDDGKGFDTDRKNAGIGLKNIQNRSELLGGKMLISSQKGMGTMIKVIFPVEAFDSASAISDTNGTSEVSQSVAEIIVR